MLTYWKPCAVVLLCYACTGCNHPLIRGAIISGVVVDFAGEGLPGVSVKVEGTPYQDLTDARGRYSVWYRPGEVTLRFAKTGFAPAEQRLDLPGYDRLTHDLVELWRLPPDKGVHLLENFRYAATDLKQVQAFTVYNEGVVHGVRGAIESTTENPEPLLVSFRMPRYDARLSRLEQREVNIGPSKEAVNLVDVWVSEATLRISLEPVDEPAELLTRVALPGSLEPGVYAVHWGGLEGFTAIDDHLFAFRVAPPPEPEGPEEPHDAETAREDEERSEETSADEPE